MPNIEKNGFTLVELMVTVAILGILLAVAIPNYQSFILNSRMTTQANELLTTLNYTRSEAVKRNTRVTMCKSSNGTTCSVTTGASASWQPGWIIFVDGGAPGIIDGTDLILKVHDPLKGGSTLVGSANVINYVSYVSNGQTQLASGFELDATFSLCSQNATISRRKIVLAQGTGRTRVDKVVPSATCTAS